MTTMNSSGDISTIPFGSRRIGPGLPVVVIAEIGINHEGDVEFCAEMVRQAAKAGCDAVKFQTIDPDENYAPGTPSHEVFSRACLSRDQTARMFDLARSLDMDVFTTCGDFPTLDWVNSLGPAAHKISSGLLTHLPLIARAAATGRTLLMSTGMTGVEQVDAAVVEARTAGCRDLGIFQCTSRYPTPPAELHLRRIGLYAHRYGVPTGLSDHSEGLHASVLAVAAGAFMLEKHFSLDNTRAGYDHCLSLTPEGMGRLVLEVRRAEEMLGTDDFGLSEVQAENARRNLRSLAARRDIAAGEVLEEGMIAFLRTLPENRGLEPGKYAEILGRTLKRPVRRFQAIQQADLAEEGKEGSSR
ncbi:MAG: N-acetylneuraminate synthase family protein [Desulfovibrionaceae bacterium]